MTLKTETEELRATVREGYQILLRAEAQLLLPEEKPKIADFYRKTAGTCMRWAEQIYGEELRREFCALEGIREKSQFCPQRYRFRMRCPWEEEGYAVILCESDLTGQWKIPQKSYHRISHVWNLSEESILPFSQILRRFGMRLRQEKLPFSPDGIYPEGEKMVFFRNATDQTTFLEKKIERCVSGGGDISMKK